jgi:hypothetical protein
MFLPLLRNGLYIAVYGQTSPNVLAYFLCFGKDTSRLMRSPFYVSLCTLLPIVARLRLGKHVPATMNTQQTLQDLLDESLSMRCASYQTKSGDLFSFCMFRKYRSPKPVRQTTHLRWPKRAVKLMSWAVRNKLNFP